MKNIQIECLSVDELLEKLREVLKELHKNPSEQPEKKDNLYTRKQTADLFQVTNQTLHNWKKNKILTPITIGTRVYYRKDDIDKIIHQKGGHHEN